MSLTIDDPETVAAIRRLAERRHESAEAVVRLAVEAEFARDSDRPRPSTVSDAERARRRAATVAIQAEFARWPKTGLVADKAFFDSLED